MGSVTRSKTFVYVKLSLYGLHYWPSPSHEEVQFLKSPHGHTFHFKLTFEVDHNDRDIEFFMTKSTILKFLQLKFKDDKLPNGILNFGSASCEQLAQLLLEQFNAFEVDVSEDNLDGAIVRRI